MTDLKINRHIDGYKYYQLDRCEDCFRSEDGKYEADLLTKLLSCRMAERRSMRATEVAFFESFVLSNRQLI